MEFLYHRLIRKFVQKGKLILPGSGFSVGRFGGSTYGSAGISSESEEDGAGEGCGDSPNNSSSSSFPSELVESGNKNKELMPYPISFVRNVEFCSI